METIKNENIFCFIEMSELPFHFIKGPIAIRIRKIKMKGAKIVLQYCGPTEMLSPVKTDNNIGYVVPTITTVKIKIKKQLFNKIEKSLLNKTKLLLLAISFGNFKI